MAELFYTKNADRQREKKEQTFGIDKKEMTKKSTRNRSYWIRDFPPSQFSGHRGHDKEQSDKGKQAINAKRIGQE